MARFFTMTKFCARGRQEDSRLRITGAPQENHCVDELVLAPLLGHGHTMSKSESPMSRCGEPLVLAHLTDNQQCRKYSAAAGSMIHPASCHTNGGPHWTLRKYLGL